ncbi:MAG: IMP cyclohydrolase, partial [Pygmaiobacter sp.]
IYDTMADGGSFSRALRTRTFEPDAPNFTPRISGYVKVSEGKMRYRMSLIKSDDNNNASVERFFYEYPQPLAGEGRFLHTYRCDGDPIPSFMGEPERVRLAGDIDRFTEEIWSNLDESNKVSLFTRYIPLDGGKPVSRIVNKYAKITPDIPEKPLKKAAILK